jgi:adenylate kinase family enzyme
MPPDPPFILGRRVAVWGVTGAGKTTVSRRVSEALRLPLIELDAIRHATGWDTVDFLEMRDVVEKRLVRLRAGWVIDGSYSPVHDLYLPRTDTLIWLHLPWRVCFWRLLKRTISRLFTREPVYHDDGPRESWRLTFLTRRSILWWSISNYRSDVRLTRERIAALARHVRVYELRSAREVASLLAHLEAIEDQA